MIRILGSEFFFVVGQPTTIPNPNIIQQKKTFQVLQHCRTPDKSKEQGWDVRQPFGGSRAPVIKRLASTQHGATSDPFLGPEMEFFFAIIHCFLSSASPPRPSSTTTQEGGGDLPLPPPPLDETPLSRDVAAKGGFLKRDPFCSCQHQHFPLQ